MMKRTPKTPALAKMAMLLLFAIAAVAILNTTSISAQELGRTITSPFGVANPYMNASDASESGSNGDTFVDPETGEVGHIIRNPFGVANPEGVDTGIDIPENAGEEVGGIITSPFGVPASDDIDTGVDVIDEDEEYLISLPKDEESDVEGAENKDGNEIRIVNSIADKWEPGDLICSGYDNIFPLNRLNGVPVGEYIEYTLYLEAVKPCNSFNGIPIQAQIVSNNWIVSSDYVVVTPYQIVFEGITSAKIENGIEKNALYNPCAIVKKIGKYAKFQFDTIPSNISCDAFNWSTSNNLRIVGENSGKKVTVRATDVADGEFTVTIDIGRDDDWNPSIKGTVFDDETRVKLFIWIVADDTVGNTPEFTVSEIDSIIKNVNYLYRQVGIRFVKAQIRYIEASQKINGIPVDYRNVANDDIGKILVQYPQNPQSPGYPRVEDGLEVFFVRTLKDGTTNGLSYEDKGIIVAKSSPDCSITLAHELGHACGLDDIYDDYLNGNFSSYESVNSLWMKRDCTYAKIPNYDNNGNNELKSATGYYTYNLSHVDLIHNLLMFGYAEVVLGEPYDRGDISLGMVYGIDYGGYRNYRKTGLEYEESGQVYYMNRTPTHKKTNSD